MDVITDFVGGVWYLCCGLPIVGFIAGAAARQIMGRRNAPFFLDIILGIAGALIGGFITAFIGFDDTLNIGFGIGAIITGTIGAIVLLFIGERLGIGK